MNKSIFKVFFYSDVFYSSFDNNILCSAVSKAFARSKYTEAHFKTNPLPHSES